MAIYSACPFLGPVLGPLLASYINQSLHWRWTWYISTIWNFAELALIILLAPETYAPRMLKDKAKKLRKETGNMNLKSAAEIKEQEMGMSKAMYVFKSTARPFREYISSRCTPATSSLDTNPIQLPRQNYSSSSPWSSCYVYGAPFYLVSYTPFSV